MRLTDAQPGARLRLDDRKIEIVDHGTELHAGAIRRWVDYRDIKDEVAAGPLLRATADDPADRWRCIRPGTGPDYLLEIEHEPGDVWIRPVTALARDWCQEWFGSRQGGVLPTRADGPGEILESARAAGLKADDEDVLASFVGAETVSSEGTGANFARLAGLVQGLYLPSGCDYCQSRTPGEIIDKLIQQAHRVDWNLNRSAGAEPDPDKENVETTVAEMLVNVTILAQMVTEATGENISPIVRNAHERVVARHRNTLARKQSGRPEPTGGAGTDGNG